MGPGFALKLQPRNKSWPSVHSNHPTTRTFLKFGWNDTVSAWNSWSGHDFVRSRSPKLKKQTQKLNEPRRGPGHTDRTVIPSEMQRRRLEMMMMILDAFQVRSEPFPSRTQIAQTNKILKRSCCCSWYILQELFFLSPLQFREFWKSNFARPQFRCAYFAMPLVVFSFLYLLPDSVEIPWLHFVAAFCRFASSHHVRLDNGFLNLVDLPVRFIRPFTEYLTSRSHINEQAVIISFMTPIPLYVNDLVRTYGYFDSSSSFSRFLNDELRISFDEKSLRIVMRASLRS